MEDREIDFWEKQIKLLQELSEQLAKIGTYIKYPHQNSINKNDEVCGHPNAYWTSAGLYCPDCGMTQ